MTGDKMTLVRRRLSDITNSLPRPKSPAILQKVPPDAASSAKEYIDHLVKENLALVKRLQEKNKIIEVAGIEIENLRNLFQKMQLQNCSLAQSNSRMLAENNMGQQKLKALQHELACTQGILKSKNLELKEQKNVNAHTNELRKIDKNEMKVVASEPGHDENSKPCKTRKRGRPSRSQSLGGPIISRLNAEKEGVESKRHCVRRRQSTSRIIHEQPSEDLVEIDDDKFLELKPSNASSTRKEAIEASYGSKFDDEGSQRTSIGGRPMRKAAVKVQSYKEIPLNVKMRRSG